MLFRFQIDPDDSHKDFKRLERWLCARPTDRQGLQYSTLTKELSYNQPIHLHSLELYSKVSCVNFYRRLQMWYVRITFDTFSPDIHLLYIILDQNETQRHSIFNVSEMVRKTSDFFCVESTVKLFCSQSDRQAGSFTAASLKLPSSSMFPLLVDIWCFYIYLLSLSLPFFPYILHPSLLSLSLTSM